MDDWLVYLLECKDGSYYCGCTNNLSRRLKHHNAGKGAAYTRGRGPCKIIAYSAPMTRSEACKLEYKVKQQPKHLKVRYLEEDQ